MTFTLYGPADIDCTGTPLSTSTSNLAGGTSLSDYSARLTALGVYRWKASYSGDTNSFPVTGNCGDATVTVGTATTTLPAGALQASVGLGDATQDAASLNGGFNNPTGTATFTLYGPSSTPVCTDSNRVFTSTKAIGAPSWSASSDPFTPTQAGIYRWIAAYSGDANNSAVSGACGDADQTVTVTFKPTLNTQAVPAQAELGSNIHAEATLVGGVNPTGTVTFILYRPFDDACYTPIFTSTKAISATGAATSDTYTLAPIRDYAYLGTYRWKASYSGDANNAPSVEQACGAPGQTVEVTRATPTLTAEATPSQAPPHTLVRDTATIGNTTNAVGSVAFRLYGPSSTPVCTAGTEVFRSATGVSGAPRNELGEIVVTSSSAELSAEGTYWWVVSYDGDFNNNAVSGACGDPGQTLTVGKITPTLTITQVIPAQARVGDPVHAKASLSGGSKSGRVFFNVYGPGSPGASCDPNNPNIVFFSCAIDGDGEALARSPATASTRQATSLRRRRAPIGGRFTTPPTTPSPIRPMRSVVPTEP